MNDTFAVQRVGDLWPISANVGGDKLLGDTFCARCGDRYQLTDRAGCDPCPHCGNRECGDA